MKDHEENGVPFGYLFKTKNKHYFYDVNTNDIIEINSGLYEYMHTLISTNKRVEEQESSYISEYHKLVESGVIGLYRPERIEMPDTDTLPYHLSNRVSGITLQVTQQCNFRCSYCKYANDSELFNHTHANKYMSWETARSAIDFLSKRVRDVSHINIGFYGGEPLLNLALIKKCINYSKELFEDKQLTFSLTTNGSLLSPEKAKYLIDNGVSITVSLDGPPEIHNKNRKDLLTGEGTFDQVYEKLTVLKKEYPDYYQKLRFNSVIDPINDGRLINKFFDNELFADNSVHTPLMEMHGQGHLFFSEKYIREYNKDILLILLVKAGIMDISCLTKIARSNYELFEKFEKKYKSIAALQSVVGSGGGCKPGALKLFATVDGRLYPCEKANDSSNVMQIGTLKDGFDLAKISNLYNLNGLSKTKCKNCWAVLLCSICPVRIDDGSTLSPRLLEKECVSERRTIARYLKYLAVIEEGKESLRGCYECDK